MLCNFPELQPVGYTQFVRYHRNSIIIVLFRQRALALSHSTGLVAAICAHFINEQASASRKQKAYSRARVPKMARGKISVA